ncbi:polymeric immunoglobulin receptor-like [Centroberyx gerrardi]
MRITVIAIVSIMTGCVSSFEVRAYSGGKVIINCKYSEKDGDKRKCLFKENRMGSEENEHAVDHMRNEYQSICGSKPRFLLADKDKYLRVSISNLEKEDEGTYTCGVENAAAQSNYTKVDLYIKNDSCCLKTVKHNVFTGGEVAIRCYYSQDHRKSIKYFCKEQAPVCDEEISSGNSTPSQPGKFSLSESNNNSFTVTIQDLTKEDKGSYWCGVKTQTAEGSYIALVTKVWLRVENWKDSSARKITFHVGENATFGCPYPSNHQNTTKFLCKGENPHRCQETVATKHQNKAVGRFSLEDNSTETFFKVHIRNVMNEDNGTYWCGTSRKWSPESHRRFDIIVGEH